jgi:ubiquinone/menaquinone biosynthesis C-methylase UbiE
MDASGSHEANRAYYDAFSDLYEARRGDNHPSGYHELIDELEAGYVKRYGTGSDVLEVGCGTGLILRRIASFARSAKGVDLSPGMLERARARGLDVVEGSATALPFENDRFDVTCSFKVLAHVPDIELALAEMARVTRPGGMILAEFYNPWSLRALLKRFGPAGRIADGADERNVYTRYDSPRAVKKLLPHGCALIGARGVRIAIPAARLLDNAVGRLWFTLLERALCDSPLRAFGGFYIAALEKRG